jgi:hypothetical protein
MPRQKQRTGAGATGHIQNAAPRRELQQLAEALGQFQASGMKRVAQQEFGYVTFVKLCAALLDFLRVSGC